MTNPTPTIEPHTERRGGPRPGAGAPRRNRNALKPPQPDPLAFIKTLDLHPFLRLLPPATRELTTLALRQALGEALAHTDRVTHDLGFDEQELAFKRAYLHTTQLVLTALTDAWKVRASRDRREEAAVRALRPWLRIEPIDRIVAS